MKKRVTERVLVLILSIAVLLSSTGAYSAFASNENTSLSATSSTEKSTSAAQSTTSANETTTSADNGNSQQPNIVEQGGAVESGALAGQGTAQNPYKIASADDFIKMQDVINDSSKSDKHFVLTADINLSGVKMLSLRQIKRLQVRLFLLTKISVMQRPRAFGLTLTVKIIRFTVSKSIIPILTARRFLAT